MKQFPAGHSFTIADYGKRHDGEWWGSGVGGNSFLRNKAREFCLNCGISPHYHTDYTQPITLCAFRHFALKYKETMK